MDGKLIMKRLYLLRLGTRSRFAIIGYGFIILIWLTHENSGTFSVAILGIGLAIFGSIFSILNRFGGQSFSLRQGFLGIIVLGTLIGLFSAISTTLLMFFKSSWHAHRSLDYSPQMMGVMLSRAPV
jgi:hypothetical protein